MTTKPPLWPLELRRFGAVVELESRAAVYQEGEVADGVFLLVAGAAKVTRTRPNGEDLILELVWPGMPFGDEGLVPGRKWMTSARTLSRSRLLHLSRDAVAEAMRTSPHVALDLVQRMARRNGAVHERMLELTWPRPEDRIETALERLKDLVSPDALQRGEVDERDVASHALVSKRAVRRHPGFGVPRAVRMREGRRRRTGGEIPPRAAPPVARTAPPDAAPARPEPAKVVSLEERRAARAGGDDTPADG